MERWDHPYNGTQKPQGPSDQQSSWDVVALSERIYLEQLIYSSSATSHAPPKEEPENHSFALITKERKKHPKRQNKTTTTKSILYFLEVISLCFFSQHSVLWA